MPAREQSAQYCIDLSSAANDRGGMGRYAASIAEALVLLGVPLSAFVNDTRGTVLPPPLTDLRVVSAGLPLRRWRLRAAVSYFGGPTMDRVFGRIGLFHATDHLLPKIAAPSVFTLHDTAYLRFARYYLPRNRIYLREMIPRFLRRADRVIAVSEQTKRDALEFYGIDPVRITVIPEGVDRAFRPDVDRSLIADVRRRYRLPERFVLNVGTIQPRKNLVTLLDAFDAIRPRHRDVGLVIAGAKGWLYEGVLSRIRERGLGSDVILTGRVDDADLPAIFNAAEIFAYPSVYEGFGLPPLEALACGTPVLCSDASSLPEVVGDAGILIPPNDLDAWVYELDRLLSDEGARRDVGRRGPERASTFTWEEAGRRTLEVYRAASGSSEPASSHSVEDGQAGLRYAPIRWTRARRNDRTS
jgi:glycosyltransferase involved in cell wall biosynthesis